MNGLTSIFAFWKRAPILEVKVHELDRKVKQLVEVHYQTVESLRRRTEQLESRVELLLEECLWGNHVKELQRQKLEQTAEVDFLDERIG